MSICQCLRVVERSCKSQFVWRGITRVQAAVYEFLLRDMAIRPILDGHTELDPDEPAVPVTGLAFLCQQFVLLLRQRALDNQAAAIGLEEATKQLCQRVKSTDDKTVRKRAAEHVHTPAGGSARSEEGRRRGNGPPTLLPDFLSRYFVACMTSSMCSSPSICSNVLSSLSEACSGGYDRTI